MDRSFKAHYFPEHHLAVCRPVGVVTEERVGKLVFFVMGAEEAAPESFNRLLDLSLVTEHDFQSSVIYGYADLRREAIQQLAPFRTAIIAPSPDSQEIARIYEALMDGTNLTLRIFENAKAATEWLGVPDTVLHRGLPAAC